MPSSEPPAVIEQPKTTGTLQPQTPVKGGAGRSAQTKEPSASTETKELTGAEKKKKAKEEKAARRAQAIKEKGAPVPASPAVLETPVHSEGQKGAKVQQQKRRASTTVDTQHLPLRVVVQSAAAPVTEVPKEEDKTVEFFRHLNRVRTTSIAWVGSAIHPAVLALGLQMGNYTICGSSARLVATLQALKRVSWFSQPSWISSFIRPILKSWLGN